MNIKKAVGNPRTLTASNAERLSLQNTRRGYGLVAIVLHWLTALIVTGLFVLGVWMTGLTYYDDWYYRAPDIHRSLGMLLFLLMLGRLAWRLVNVTPEREDCIDKVMHNIALLVHWLLYLLLFALMFSGYLISTADGKPVDVFGLFEIPATIMGIANMEDIAGKVHWYLALIVIGIASLHALYALKHHFIDHDRTLSKMLGIRK